MVVAGYNDKSNIQVGDHMPLQAAPRQSNRTIVHRDTLVSACDHDFAIPKLVPSVIYFTNQSTNPGDSLYSGGLDGTGRTLCKSSQSQAAVSGSIISAREDEPWFRLDIPRSVVFKYKRSRHPRVAESLSIPTTRNKPNRDT